MNIYEKLLYIQQNLSAPKNQYNKFGKYYYRSCEDILEGLKPCLEHVKAVVTVSDEVLKIGDWYYVSATAILHDTESNDTIKNTAFAREEFEQKGMTTAQITGSTSSYARKYALNGLFCIDDVKDDDEAGNGTNKSETENTENNSFYISEKEIKSLHEKCIKDSVEINKILKLYKVNDVKEISLTKYNNICEHWEEIKRL